MARSGEISNTGKSSQPEALRNEVAAGLRYTHTRASANTGKLQEVVSFAYVAIELLAEKGLLDIEGGGNNKLFQSENKLEI